jgi:RNA polymerase sigma factor (sigma-70 family)
MADEQPVDETPDPTAGPPDGVLLRRFQNRDLDAATQLYVRYAQKLRRLAHAQCSTSLARRVEPDDIVQSVFASFFRRAAEGEYDTPDGNALWGLLLVIALNKIRAKGAYYSAAKRDVRRTSEVATFGHWLESARKCDDTIPYAFLNLVIRETLESLSTEQQQMVGLRIDGYEVDEIAERTKTAKRTVERCLQQFRGKLEKVLNESD